jgi:hypothetical protein
MSVLQLPPPGEVPGPPPRPPADNVLVGCGLGCLCQIGFLFLGFMAAGMSRGRFGNWLAVSWGVTQWLAIGPLIWQQRSQGYRNRVVGLIITGCLGLLLSAACGSVLFQLGGKR